MNKFLLGLVLGTLLGFLFAQSVSDKDSAVSAPADIRSTPVEVADRPKLISEPVAPNTVPIAEGSPIAPPLATPRAAPDTVQSSRPFSDASTDQDLK